MHVATTKPIDARGLNIEQIARDHYDSVFRFCARRAGPELAPDLTQETFVTAMRALRSFKARSSIKTWLFGIAHNECRRAARDRKTTVQTVVLDSEIADREGLSLGERDALHDALAALSADHREVVLLHELEGLTYEEAASVLRVPIGTVKSRLHNAFAQLRRTFEGGAQ